MSPAKRGREKGEMKRKREEQKERKNRKERKIKDLRVKEEGSSRQLWNSTHIDTLAMSHRGSSPCQPPSSPSSRAEAAKLSEQRSEGQRVKKAPWTHSCVPFHVGKRAPGTGRSQPQCFLWLGQLDI